MEDKEIMDRLVKLIQPYVRNEDALAKINERTEFIKDLDVNSSRLVDIVLSLEDDFDISINDEESENLVSVGDVINLLKDKKVKP